MELLREFNDNGYFTSKLYHLLTKKRMVDTAEEIIPSEYEKEMEMSCADRLKNLNNMEIDNIVVTGGQKADKPVLEFTPRILVFQNYKPHQKILAKLTVKNISKAPTFLNMRCKDSLFFSVKPLSTALVSRIAPGISYTFGVTFIPRSEFEDYTHKLTFYTDIDQYVVALIAMAQRPIINFPDEIVIPDTPLKVENCTQVLVKNIGKVPASSVLNTRCPFGVYPKAFHSLPSEIVDFKVSLKTMYLGQAHGAILATFETGEIFRIEVTGRAHIVNIQLEKATVRFLDTYNTMARQQTYKITNKSDHKLTYSCLKNESVYHDFQEKIKLAAKLYDVKETESIKHTKLVRYDIATSVEHERIYTRIFYDEIQELVVDESLHFNNSHFSITPIKGNLWPNKTTELTINFSPNEIGDFQAVVYLDIDGSMDRVPVKLMGTSLPPSIHINCETLDMDRIYLNKNYNYEILAMNTGHINGMIEYIEKPSLFGSRIVCTPRMRCLEPGEKETFTITFCNSNQGPYFEEMQFSIKDTKVVLKLYLKGEAVYPSLMFSQPCLDFGEVSIGVPKLLTLEVINESVVTVKGKFKIAADGPEISAMSLEDIDVSCSEIVKMPSPPWPREFNIVPEQVEIGSESRITIQVTLTANKVRANQTQLELELEKSDSPPIVLPVLYNAMVPEVTPAPLIHLKACFIDNTYCEEVVVQTKHHRGFFTIEEPEEVTTLIIGIPIRKGIIEPNSTIVLPITIRAVVQGLQEYSLRMSLFGLPKPIEVCHIYACAVKPIVTCLPLLLQWGQLKLLNKSTKSLTLANDSPVKVSFLTSMLNKDDRWSIAPADGVIMPESEAIVAISVCLLDAANYYNKAVIQLLKVKDIIVPVSAIGVGTSIVVGEYRDKILLGRHFTKIPLSSKVTLKNCGTRLHTLEWLPTYKTVKNVSPPTPPMLKLGLSTFKLVAGEQIDMGITGLSPKACTVSETWYLVGSVEGANKKELLVECLITAEFVDPKIELSTTLMQLQYDHGPYNEYYKLTDVLSLKNDSKLPLEIEINIKPPFAIIERQGTYKIRSEEADYCGCITYRESDLNVGKMNKEIGYQQSKELIDCLTLRAIEPLHAGPLKLFQDIHKIKTVFNLTHSIEERLEDQDTMKIQILMDTTKHINLKSKVYSDIVKIKFKGHKNKDSVKVVGKINFPNVFVVTPKVDFQCILNQGIACKTFKISNPTPLLVCFKFNWKKYHINFLTMPEAQMVDIGVQSKTVTASISRRISSIPVCPIPSIALTAEQSLVNTSPIPDSKGQITSSLLVPDFTSKSLVSHVMENVDIDYETLKKKIMQKITPMLPPERDTYFDWACKFPPVEKHRKCNINDIFQISPHRGLLQPSGMQYVNVMFQPIRNVNVHAVLECEVLGGPSESILITGQSSDLIYTLNSQKINFKIRSFHELATEKIILTNIAYLPFKYKIYLNEPNFENELEGTIRSVDPPEMLLEHKQQAEINVNMRTGVVGYYNRVFILEIGHLPHLPIEVFGWGVIPQVYLSCPRPDVLKLHVEIGYKAISDLSAEYLEAVEEIFNKIGMSNEHFNSPQIDKMFEDPLFESGWHICSSWDGYPSAMDIELAIERLLVINHIRHRPDIITPYSTHSRTGPIPNFVTFTSIIDFGVVITGSKVTYVVDVINYGPITTKVHALKSTFYSWLSIKFCGKLLPGETGKMEVTFAPNSDAFKDLEQNMETQIQVEVPYGVLMPIKLKALVAVPYLKSNMSKIDLGMVRCGDKITCSIPIKNVGKPVCIWYVTLRLKSPGPCPITILDNSGKYEAGEGGELTIAFKPTMEMFYEGMLVFRFHMNPTRMIIPIVGTGILPHVHVIGPNIVFPPTLPWADTLELYFALTNPCPFPIELIMAHSDKKWQEEEDMLILLSKYYNKLEEMLIPIVKPGTGWPSEIPRFYKLFQDTVRREKELETAATALKSQTSPAKKGPVKSPKGSPSPKGAPSTKEIKIPRKTRTEAEIISDCINKLKNMGVDPLRECFESVELSKPVVKAQKTKGVIFMVSGSPCVAMSCLELAYNIGKELKLQTVNVDKCVTEALCICSGTAQVALVNGINDQCQIIKKLLLPIVDPDEEIEETGPEDENDDEDEKLIRMQWKLEYLAANRTMTVQQSQKSKSEKDKKVQPPTIADLTGTASVFAPPSSPYLFQVEYVQELLEEFFSSDKFSMGFVVDSLTSFIFNSPALAMTTILKAKPSIANIHLVLCQGTFESWLQSYEEGQSNTDAFESPSKEYSDEEIKDIILSFEEMNAVEYEHADPEERAIYIRYGLEQRREKLKGKGQTGVKTKHKEKKESPTNHIGTSESKKKIPTKAKPTLNYEVTEMSERYAEYARIFDQLLSTANNWIAEDCELGSPIYTLPGQMAAAVSPKKLAKKPEILPSTIHVHPEDDIPPNRGFPVTIISCPCVEYKMALVKMLIHSPVIQRALETEEKVDILTCPMKKNEYTVLLPKTMPIINHAEPLTWLYLTEKPIKKCECNQITDLNLVDDSTQENVLNIMSKWHCTCGIKLVSSKTSTTEVPVASMEALSQDEDDGIFYPQPLHSVKCVTEYSDIGARIVLQPGDLLRCKYTYSPQEEGSYGVKRFVEVFGWPDSKVDINVSGICDIPRLDSRPKKMFEHFVRRRVEEAVYKKTFLDDIKIFEFGPIFIGQSRMYEENDTISLRNCSLLPSEVYIEFEDFTNVFQLDEQYIQLQPGAQLKIEVSAAPTVVGVHTSQLLLCIKDNPEIIKVTIACTGVTPDIEILPQTKMINYGKVLLYRREDDRFIIKNDSVLPIMWKVRNYDDFLKHFIISHTSGIVQSNENQVVPITYIACEVSVIAHQMLTIDIYDELGRGTPMMIDMLFLSAECYDVMVECAYEDPALNYLNFGNVRVNSRVHKEMYLMNRGKYNIYYKLKKVKNFPNPALLKSFQATPESGVVPPTLKLTVIGIECTPAENVNLSNVPAYICSLLDTSKKQVVVAQFPVCITLAAFYNTFTLFPLGEMNFHIIDVGTSVSREVILNNTSKCPIIYEIIVPEKYHVSVETDPMKAAKAKDTKLKFPPVKCGNFLIMIEDNLLPPGTSRKISIQFTATEPRLFEETVHFQVSDTCPAEAAGVPFKLVGMGATPTLDFWNVKTTFREHIIVKTFSDYKKNPQTIPHCVFVEDTVTLYFCSVIVHTSYKAALDLYNNGLVTCCIAINLQYQSNTDKKIFSVDRSELFIEPMMHKKLTITFSPKELLEYRAVLSIRLKLLDNEEQSFKVCLVAVGTIPRIKLISPPVRLYRLSDLEFPMTSLGSTSTKSIVIKNISQLRTTAKVKILQSPHESRPLFTTSVYTDGEKQVPEDQGDKTELQTKVTVVLDNDQTSKILIHFNPLYKGRANCDIKITIKHNPYEFFTIFCSAEAFIEDVMLIGLQMLSMEIDMESFRADATQAGIISQAAGDKKKSKSAPPPDKKKKDQKVKGKKVSQTSVTAETSELKYVLDFGGCEIFNMHRRSVIMVNNSEKVYKFTWEMLTEIIMIKPSVGYISPGEEKDLEVMFFSPQPVIVRKEPLTCNLVAVSNDKLILDTKGATWDSRQTLTMFADNQDLNLQERIETLVHGPPTPTSDDCLSTITINIYYSGVTEYVKYTTNLEEEISLDDTYIYESTSFEFQVTNVGNVPMKISWSFIINDEYPRRLDKPYIRDEPEISPSTFLEGSVRGSTEACVDEMVNDSIVQETKKDGSKLTLFSKSESRQSVDTWFEVDLPFKIEPEKQCLEPGQTKTFKVTFNPQDAFDYKVLLMSTIENSDPYDQNLCCNISVRALVPLVHLDLEESDYISSGRRKPAQNVLPPFMKCMEFNILGVGCYKKTVHIVNPTSEGYEYLIENIIDTSQKELVPVHCNMLKGFVDAGSSQEVMFTFTPTNPGVYESQWKISITEHSLVLYLMVVGLVREPDVEFVPTLLVIENTLVGFPTDQEVILRNNEQDVTVTIRFNGHTLINESGINALFVTPEKAILKPRSQETIKITYTPQTDGPASFKIYYSVSHLIEDLTLSIRALSYSITPSVVYYLFGNEHVLSSIAKTNIYLDQTASEYERTIKFKLKNNGSATFRYDWVYTCAKVKKYLQVWVEPKSGFVGPGTEIDCILHFLLRTVPVKAFPVDLEITNGPLYKICLYADIEKPLYHFSCKYYDFGQCIIGAPDTHYHKHFAFFNDDKVPISLNLTNTSVSELLIDFVQEPVVKPNKHVKIPIYFRPKAVKEYEFRLQFWVNTLCEEIIIVKGRGVPLLIDLYEGCEKSYYLGPVDAGSKVVRDISVMNHSKVPVDAQFLFTDAYPAFALEATDSLGSSICMIPSVDAMTAAKTEDSRVMQALKYKVEKTLTQQNDDCLAVLASLKVIPSRVVIQPFRRVTLKVQYKPVTMIRELTSVVMSVKVLEIVKPLVVLSGSATGYNLQFNQNSVQFGNVRKYGMKSMSVLLINSGNYLAKFWFQPLKNPEFKITPTSGEVEARSQCLITIVFRPQNYNPFSKVWVNCNFNNHKPLELVLYAACGDEGPPQTASLVIECPVRETKTEYISVPNPTDENWCVEGEISAPFETLREFVIEKLTTFEIPITFKPLSMGRHEVKATYSPLGLSALFVELVGIATPPFPTGTIDFTIEAKVPKTLELRVHNVAERPEIYDVLTEVDRVVPNNFTGYYEVKFSETLDVWGEASGTCFWTFVCYEPCEMVCRVIFVNRDTREYQYYLVNITVIKNPVVNTVTFVCRAREKIQQEINITNPLDTPSEFYVHCDRLNLAESIQVERNSEKKCTLSYNPLVVGEFEDSLTIANTLIGTSVYRVIAQCLPAKPKFSEHTTTLGSCIPIRLRVNNYTDTRTNFIASTTHPSIILERDYFLNPGEKGKFLVWFEPTQLGEQESRISFNSVVAGEFVFDIKGMAKKPTPQGPYYLATGQYTTIRFKNVFTETRNFKVFVDNRDFYVERLFETIQPKQEVRIKVFRSPPDEEQSIMHTKDHKPTGILIIETSDSPEPYVQWNYFLHGV